MTTLEVGKRLVELCREGKNDVAIKELYSPDIVSVEAEAPPGMSAETRGMQGVVAKGTWWAENHTVHSAKAEGPFPHGDRFIVRFTYDITIKRANQRVTMDEAALFTVADGKIVREEFFYTAG
jgi:ketosteroid isomerase-like protein